MERMFHTYSFRSLCLLRYSIEYYIQNFEKFFVFGSMDVSYPAGKQSFVVTYIYCMENIPLQHIAFLVAILLYIV
jgi:hypothetical protein